MGFLSSSNTSNSSVTPTLAPQFEPLQASMIDQLFKRLNTPMDIAPFKNAATENVNRSYAAAPQRISEQMAQRGYGSSGRAGGLIRDSEFARIRDVNALEPQFAGMQMEREAETLRFIDNLLAQLRGRTGTETQKNSPSILSSILGVAGAGLGVASGMGAFGGGGGLPGGTQNWMSNFQTTPHRATGMGW